MKGYISTTEAGLRLGVTAARVRALIADGRLPAERVGRAFIIRETDLVLVADRKAGWPAGRPRDTERLIQCIQCGEMKPYDGYGANTKTKVWGPLCPECF